ncbi:polyprenyl synthetase family protein [Streptomyces collinus]|uniref:polyprenyl synthetase family protein n=1 Tax=Streptomyces collinus TaxID=42684 RepID=UPI002942687F|nr:polyprenyl synthetase family protein [Streptomyces collinus]
MPELSATQPVREASGPPPGEVVQDIAAVTRGLVLPPLRSVVEGLHADLARLCGHHFGWSDLQGRPTGTEDAGKLLRARVALLAAAAAGGEPTTAVPGAVAVELVHNFSLLHDDIMDADERRRGRATAWAAFGIPSAVLGGDALTALALRQLTAIPGQAGRTAVTMLVDALHDMTCGQAADLALDRIPGPEVTYRHYFDASYKTTALLAAAAAIGAVLGGAPGELVGVLHRAAADVGLAWQIANDVEDIWGDPAVTGKQAFSDLRLGKKTLPVIAALRSGTDAGQQLTTLLGSAGTEEELRLQADLIEAAGGRRYAEELSTRHLQDSLAGLARSLPPTAARDELTALFRFVVTRVP